jgi:hypothetical protein
MYYNNGPSRINPRIPLKRSDSNVDDDVDIGDLLEDEKSSEEQKSLISSLIVDTSKTRTPMDLIQVFVDSKI